MERLEKLFPDSAPPSESDIKAVETKIGVRLPGDYRQFLLKTGGGIPSASCYSDGRGTSIYVQNTFRVGNPDSPVDLSREIDTNPASRGFFSARVPIATANGGDYLMIHKKKGTIYLWEHETDKVNKICDSWNDLLAGLKEDFDD